jgi:hypothetical protein
VSLALAEKLNTLWHSRLPEYRQSACHVAYVAECANIRARAKPSATGCTKLMFSRALKNRAENSASWFCLTSYATDMPATALITALTLPRYRRQWGILKSKPRQDIATRKL